MIWRRRKMMLRRKTDPKAGTHTLREPAQWKCLWRFRKSHFRRKCTGKMLRPMLSPERRHTLCASLRSRNACQDFTRATLYEPAQSKRVSRFHRSHFMQKFTGKMPQTRVSTLIKHRPLLLTQEPLSVDTLCGEKAFSRVWGFE